MTIRFRDTSPSPELPPWPQALDQIRLPQHRSGEAPGALVRVSQQAVRQAWEHLAGYSEERGGLLIGQAWSIPGRPLEPACIDIVAAIPGLEAEGTGYSLRMGASVWSRASEVIDQTNLGLPAGALPLRCIGWFHSHPRLGVFFSETDRATQRAFFAQPWSVGWVIDPFEDDSEAAQAFFLGADCKAPGAIAKLGENCTKA